MRTTIFLILLAAGAALIGCGPPPGDTAAGDDAAPPAKAPAAPPPRDDRPAQPAAPLGPAGPDGSRVRVGQAAPDFEVTTTDGQRFRLGEQRGKVVLVNFFATWCPPCVAEMPHLQREVFEKIKGDRFAMISLGRKHDNAEVARFKETRRLGFPMAGDPGRTVFAQYAERSIPRTVVVDTDGRVIFQTVGFGEKEFRDMVSLIRARVGRR
jgi:peroxiredoxin